MPRRIPLAAACLLAGLLPTPAAGQTAYTTAGAEIYSVNVAGPTFPSSLVHTSTVIVGDVARGADGFVYFTEPALRRVSRVPPSGTLNKSGQNPNAAVLATLPVGSTPQEIRLTAQGDVLVGSSGGIWKIDLPSNTLTQVTSSGSGGLGIAHDGGLLYTDGSSVNRNPSAGFTPIIGLSSPVSVTVANGGDGAVAALSAGAILISDGMNLLMGPKDGGSATQVASFADAVRHVEVLSDHTMLVATSVSALPVGNSVANHNGRLWKVDLDGSGAGPAVATLVFEAGKKSGQWQPTLGAGVSATSRKIVDTSAHIGLHDFQFGSHFFRATTTGSCLMSVEALQKTKGEVDALLAAPDSTGIGSVAYLSEEGWYIVYDVNVLSGTGSCAPDIKLYIAAYFDGPPSQNTALVHIGTPNQVITTGVYPFGGVPGDGGGSGETDNLSPIVLGVSITAGTPATFCGLGAPLNALPVVSPPDISPAAIQQAEDNAKNLGQDLTFKFFLSTSGNCTNGPFIGDTPGYPFTGALLSVQSWPEQVPFEIHPKGQANDPPLFRVDPSTLQHTFNLDTTLSLSAPWAPGLYIITISSLDGQFLPSSVLLKVQ
jgi:hypothetical protein